jgi:hypothetical protein
MMNGRDAEASFSAVHHSSFIVLPFFPSPVVAATGFAL